MSVSSKTNLDDDDLSMYSSQSIKNGKSYSKNKMSENQCANYVLSFCDWAMGTMSESCYANPHQEQCVGKMCGAKMSNMLHWCEVRVHSICQIDWLKQHCLEVNHDDQFFCQQHNECYQNCV